MTLEMITIHTIVCNEDRFIKAALTSVLESSDVTRALVWDAGSIDKTVTEIQSINDPRIEFRQLGKVDRKQLVEYRNEQLKLTKTPWFMLLDGDEIWPKKNLKVLISAMKQCSHLPAVALRSETSVSKTSAKEGGTIALVNRTRNAVGDLYHYLPESEGHYQIGPWKGHLNIRAIRIVGGLSVEGEYPDEWYELGGKKIQDYPECSKDSPLSTQRTVLKKCLRFIDTWYLHTTHLRRSSSLRAGLTTIDRLKKRKWFFKLKSGVKVMMLDALPEVLRKGDNGV